LFPRPRRRRLRLSPGGGRATTPTRRRRSMSWAPPLQTPVGVYVGPTLPTSNNACSTAACSGNHSTGRRRRRRPPGQCDPRCCLDGPRHRRRCGGPSSEPGLGLGADRGSTSERLVLVHRRPALSPSLLLRTFCLISLSLFARRAVLGRFAGAPLPNARTNTAWRADASVPLGPTRVRPQGPRASVPPGQARS